MNSTEEKQELEFDDVEFAGGAEKQEIPTIPEDMYFAKLVGFRSEVDKPDWVIDRDFYKAQKKDPATTREDIDTRQYEFTFEITVGDYIGTRLTMFCNRTFHERSTAGMVAAALMGVDKFNRAWFQAQGGTRILQGKPCKIDVVEVPSKNDPALMRNYVNAVKRIPEQRARPERPQKPQETRNREAVPRKQLDGYPTDVPEDDIPF